MFSHSSGIYKSTQYSKPKTLKWNEPQLTVPKKNKSEILKQKTGENFYQLWAELTIICWWFA